MADVISRTLGFLFACASLLAATTLGDALAQPRLEAPEASVKAAFLHKFPGYIEWPASAFASPSAPFVFGVLGEDEVAAELERLTAGRQWSGRPMMVKRLDGDNFSGLQVLFVGRAVGDRLGTVVRAAQLPGLLVVTENDRGLATGSAINFVVHDERVGFEVSPEAAERSGLRISSRMLAVARRVAQR
ncbi:MAG TPA: YfiR family protein [Usitatibacter sp.]|jgi:hypothetical protein|nr:YfiR family protein [Usitatibacter sp.]